MSNITENQRGVPEEFQDLGGGVFLERERRNLNTTSNAANATNAVATATIAARGKGLRTLVTRIIGGFSDLTKTGTVTLNRGANAVFVYPFTGNFNIELHLLGNDNEAVSAAISAGGTGVIGYIAIHGSQPGS